MSTKHYVDDLLQVSESRIDDNIDVVTVYVPCTEAGGSYDAIQIYELDEPYLRGDDYPTLVEVWNNQEDEIYDTL